MKVLHVITGLDAGGAETMLLKLLDRIDRRVFDNAVLSLSGLGLLGPRIAALGVKVEALGLSPSLPNPLALFGLARRIRAAQPDIVHCWMYHGNLLGGIAARLAGAPRVLWSIRQTNVDAASIKRRTIAVVKAGAWLSRLVPDGILGNAETSRRAHVALGYDAARFGVIPNGFDLDRFRPDADARAGVRAELGVAPDAPLIGLIARYDVQKDHATFLRAAGLLVRSRPDIRFVLAGGGVEERAPALAALLDETGTRGRARLLGHRDDVPRLTAALDIGTSSSIGEGFANAVGEAMAAGLPTVVTDVGDSRAIVGATGIVVAPGDPAALAAGWAKLLDLPADERARLGAAARARVAAEWSLDAVVRRYEDCYRRLAEAPR